MYGELDHWKSGEFVPVSVSEGVYYGGFQMWLTEEGISEYWANRSCGITAAANMLYYVSKNIAGKSQLYTKSKISKSDFSAFQKELYDYCMSPSIIGIPFMSTLKSKVEAWANYRNVQLNGVISNAAWTEANVRDYIAAGLNAECPVLLLTWNSPIAELQNHWVTVTRIYLDKTGSVKILTSNWAEMAEYDYSAWFAGASINQSVIYFQ